MPLASFVISLQTLYQDKQGADTPGNLRQVWECTYVKDVSIGDIWLHCHANVLPFEKRSGEFLHVLIGKAYFVVLCCGHFAIRSMGGY